MSAGQLKERLQFFVRSADANGDPLGNWEPSGVPVRARVIYLKGGEAVQAERLAGVQPVSIRIYRSRWSRTITTAFMARDTRLGVEFNLRTVAPDETGAWIDMMADSGGANG